MPFSSWRGTVGIINPTMRPGVTAETDAAVVQRLLARSAATPRDVIARYDALGDAQKT